MISLAEKLAQTSILKGDAYSPGMTALDKARILIKIAQEHYKEAGRVGRLAVHLREYAGAVQIPRLPSCTDGDWWNLAFQATDKLMQDDL